MKHTLTTVPSERMPAGKDWLIVRTADEIVVFMRCGVISGRSMASCWSAVRQVEKAAERRAAELSVA